MFGLIPWYSDNCQWSEILYTTWHSLCFFVCFFSSTPPNIDLSIFNRQAVILSIHLKKKRKKKSALSPPLLVFMELSCLQKITTLFRLAGVAYLLFSLKAFSCCPAPVCRRFCCRFCCCRRVLLDMRICTPIDWMPKHSKSIQYVYTTYICVKVPECNSPAYIHMHAYIHAENCLGDWGFECLWNATYTTIITFASAKRTVGQEFLKTFLKYF